MENKQKNLQWVSTNSLILDNKYDKDYIQKPKHIPKKKTKYNKNINPSNYFFSSPHFYLYHYN